MAKRTKFSKFRELHDVIEDLAGTYTYEGVVEILAERHDLKLTTGTLTNYLYRYRKESKELSVATDNSNTKVEIKHSFPQQSLGKSQDGEPNQENKLGVDNKRRKRATPEELEAVLERMKKEMAEEEYNGEDFL